MTGSTGAFLHLRRGCAPSQMVCRPIASKIGRSAVASSLAHPAMISNCASAAACVAPETGASITVAPAGAASARWRM